jgi:tRNA(Glu) U13 pseudouridine synthase TruD
MISLRVKNGIPLFSPIKGDVISILDEKNGLTTRVLYKYGDLYDAFLKKAIELNRAVIIAPIIGFETKIDDFPAMASMFSEILHEERINPTIFKSDWLSNFEFKGSFRALAVKPVDLQILEIGDDELFPEKKKIKLEFSLQKGSYATMLIREIIK